MRLAILMSVVLLASACIQYNQSTGQWQVSPNVTLPKPGPGPIIPPLQKPDDGPVGSLNHAYLQATPYSKIIIEIDYVEGFEPIGTTNNEIKKFFEEVAGKPVTFSGGNVITPTKNVYTVQDLVELEKANRQHYTEGDTAVVYFMFVNGAFEKSGALGVVYKASTVVIFPERISDATTALIFYFQIERAVAMHELGHLMGLVNINYKSERDHEDPEHPSHSKNANSVMFWAVEDISLKNILNFGPPDEFDSDDLFDLQKIKEGVY